MEGSKGIWSRKDGKMILDKPLQHAGASPRWVDLICTYQRWSISQQGSSIWRTWGGPNSPCNGKHAERYCTIWIIGQFNNLLSRYDSSLTHHLGLTIVFVTPIFPLSMPAITRLVIRPVNDVEKPNETIEKANPIKPIIRTVFLPIRSESRPHCRTQQPNRAKVRVYTHVWMDGGGLPWAKKNKDS